MQDEEGQRRAITYSRVSTIEQANEQFCSLDGQEERCRSLAAARDWTVVAALRDVSTGGNTDRSSLQELLQRAKSHDFDTLIVYKLDRLSRSVLDFWQIVSKLEERDIALVSVTESFDSATPAGRLMMNLLASFAEFEREQIKARTKQGLASRAAAGWWPMRWRPFGYDRKRAIEDGPVTLVPNDRARWAVEAFKGYMQGHGASLIAQTLNDEGLMDSQGQRWTRRAVRRMLGNPAYVGIVQWNGERYEGKHPAIIDAEVWRVVQERLADGQRGQPQRCRGYEDTYRPALIGILRNGKGEPFGRTWSIGRKRRHYSYYLEPGGELRFNAESFDEELMRALRDLILTPEMFAGVFKEAEARQKRKAAELQQQIDTLTGELKQLELQEGRLVNAIAQGVDAERVKAKLGDIGESRAMAEKKIAECEMGLEKVGEDSNKVSTFAELREFFEAVREGSEYIDPYGILRAMVRNVTVDRRAKRLAVSLNLPDVADFSNREIGRSDAKTEKAAPAALQETALSPLEPKVVREEMLGDAEGTRTPNHRIDSPGL